MFVMVDECKKFKIVEIVNISGTALTDVNGDKYNIEKVKYVWKDRIPRENPEYIYKHLLEEKNT